LTVQAIGGVVIIAGRDPRNLAAGFRMELHPGEADVLWQQVMVATTEAIAQQAKARTP
jgi:hypothetical protein